MGDDLSFEKQNKKGIRLHTVHEAGDYGTQRRVDQNSDKDACDYFAVNHIFESHVKTISPCLGDIGKDCRIKIKPFSTSDILKGTSWAIFLFQRGRKRYLAGY